MASIIAISKNGKICSYKFKVYVGRDPSGKQVFRCSTWHVPDNLSPAKARKAAEKSGVFVKRKCEQKGPKKVSTFSTRFHVVSNVFPKYQMLTF